MTIPDKTNRILTSKIRGIDLVALAVDGLQTLWTPAEGSTFFLLNAIIQCKSKTGTVTTAPIADLTINSSPITGNLTLPTTVGNAGEFPFELRTASTGVAVTFTDVGDLVTTTVPHNLNPGDQVVFPTVVTTTGITAATPYFAIPSLTNAAVFQVASTYANAIARTAIVLGTGDGNGTLTVAGRGGNRFTNDLPLKFRVVLGQAGATVLTYDLVLVGVELSK